MSHQIDFGSLGLTARWNGHRAYPEVLWKFLIGNGTHVINRHPHSVHRDMMVNEGFEVILDLKNSRTDGIARSELSRRWKHITDDDLNCSGAFMQARKKVETPVNR